MKKLASFLFIAGILYCLNPARAADPASRGLPQWSEAQKEVWEAVQAMSSSWTTEPNLELNDSLVHPDYLGLYTGDPIPDDKPVLLRWLKNAVKSRKVIYKKETPQSIKIVGDIAIVFSVQSLLFKDADGKDQFEIWSYHSVLKKENGKWLLFSEAGVMNPKAE